MGASDPLPDSGPGRYRFIDHREYLDELLMTIGVDREVVIVGHDWGAVLGIDWARRHPHDVRGIAYMETLVAPVSWDGRTRPTPELFGPLRTEEGERLVLRDNVFVEKVLPAGTRRTLTVDERAAYRAPYLQPGESRRPTLTWPREIPIDGHPADVAAVVTANAAWMATSPVPKLFINGDPGALLTGPLREQCRRWPHQREVTVPGLHFLPEDAPREIADALTTGSPRCPGESNIRRTFSYSGDELYPHCIDVGVVFPLAPPAPLALAVGPGRRRDTAHRSASAAACRDAPAAHLPEVPPVGAARRCG
jgi:haloalkane dehalogenase